MHAQQQFDAVADAYLTSAVHAHGKDLKRAAGRIAQRPEARVLDVGCGAGHLTYAAAAVAREVTAYDLSERMLALVQQTARERGLDNVRTLQGPAETLPFADASFDVVASRFSAHHWLDLPAALAEIRRVLVPDGTVVMIDVLGEADPLVDTHLQAVELFRDASHVRDYSSAQWHAAFKQAGLDVKEELHWWLPMQFDSWIARSNTPPERASAIKNLLAQAPTAVRRRLQVQDDGSFALPVGQFDAVPAAAVNPLAALGTVLVP